ncbi:hypothetical protein HKD37_17G048491 [Glycine soja]
MAILRRVSLQFFQEGNWTHDDLFEDTELEGDTEEDLYQRLLYSTGHKLMEGPRDLPRGQPITKTTSEAHQGFLLNIQSSFCYENYPSVISFLPSWPTCGFTACYPFL